MKRNQKPQNLTITVHGDHITLGQLLKTANIIGSGGEAKFYLADTPVTVNGEAENRRGRKLRPGDVMTCPQAVVQLVGESDS